MKINYFYIDPGTGSMLFTVLIGLISAGIYAIRGLLIKLKFFGGKKSKNDSNDYIPYVIYADNKRYFNIFEPIINEFEKRKINLTYMTSSKDDKCFDKKYEYINCEFIGEGNKAFAKLNMLKADILFSTTPGLDVYQWKRSRDVKYYVHIPHAASDITVYRMFGIDYYDAIILSGDYQVDQIRKLEELRNLPNKELKVLGIPYMDEMKKRLDNNQASKKEKDIQVIVAPSWGESAILKKFGSKIIDELLNTGYKIVVRPHPQSFISEKEMIEELMNKDPNVEWNRDVDNFDVLNDSDILISDFSGVMFDFALVYDKPIIYADTSFDSAPYDAAWIDEELWTFRVLPSIGKQLTEDNMSNIKGAIDECLKESKYKEGRDKAREETWANIGSSSKLIADYLINKHKEITETKNDNK